MAQAQLITRATHGDSLADILERVLNTGVVIAGDIRVKLCDVELLTIQLRLLICSVEKAKELGVGWWWQEPSPSEGTNHSDKSVTKTPPPAQGSLPESESDIRIPPEQYQKFQEFQRFQAAMQVVEEGPRSR